MKKFVVILLFSFPFTATAQLVSGLNGPTGSAIGPGQALYVTESGSGRLLRVDRHTGDYSVVAEGLPLSPLFGILGFGGAVDVEFIGETPYVLVSVAGFPFSGAIDGIYRIDGLNSYTVIADIGLFSSTNTPPLEWFPWELPNGVPYSLEKFRDGFLVTDGHHNRVLYVTLDGDISEFKAYQTDVVPTGLEVAGNSVFLSHAGPVPHLPENGKVLMIDARTSAGVEIASGAPLLVDVTRGRGRSLFALSQGAFPADGVPAQSALPDTGAILEVGGDGQLAVVVDGLDRPTSLEIIQNTAYVVTLAGTILEFPGLGTPPHGKR